jgi:MFS family permease
MSDRAGTVPEPAQRSGTSAEAASSPDDTTPRGRARLVLILLFLVYSLNYLDRQVINILGQSIKTDLHLSDLQLGLLSGTAFGIFYSLLGLPLARLADRMNRVYIIAAAITVWSVFTSACSLAQSYIQLFLLRLGVGVGEAGGTPPSQSLISDYFPAARRGTAMAVFNMGVPFGSFLGFLLGGYLNDFATWRTALLVAGLPGLLLAPALLKLIPEPVRGAADGRALAASAPRPSAREAVRTLLAKPSYVALILGGTFGIFIIYVTNTWLPPLFIRLHGMTAKEVGSWMALCIGGGGAIGTLGGGMLADVLRRRFARAEIWMLMVSTALTAPAVWLTVTAQSEGARFGWMFVLYTLGYVWIGPTSAMVQRVSPVPTRALATGIQLFIANITALAFGPPLVGYASDRLVPVAGAHSLQWALMGAALVAFCGTIAYGIAGRHILRDVGSTNPPAAA